MISASSQYYSLQSLFIPIFIACVHFPPKDFLYLSPSFPATYLQVKKRSPRLPFLSRHISRTQFLFRLPCFFPICFSTLLYYLHSAINPSDKPRILLLLVLHLPLGLHSSTSKICQTLVTLVLSILELFLIYAFSERGFAAGIIF